MKAPDPFDFFWNIPDRFISNKSSIWYAIVATSWRIFVILASVYIIAASLYYEIYTLGAAR